jgi:hypothetical protein
MSHVSYNILHQQLPKASVGILASTEIHSLPIRIFLAIVAPQENNRHELDFLLRSFARYTITTTIAYCNGSRNRGDEYKEGEALSTFSTIPTPISILLPLSQCSMNCLGGFEMPHGLSNLPIFTYRCFCRTYFCKR